MSNPTINPDDLERLFARNKAVFDWCLRSIERELRANRLEQAAEWCYLGARAAVFDGWFGYLASAELESLIVRLGHALAPFPNRSTRSANRRWLHVMTTAYAVGGHTNMVCRWIQNRCDREVHHVVVTRQSEPLPEKLKVAVENAGGRLLTLKGENGRLQKIAKLKALVADLADVVVLHIHPYDVDAVLAFANEGGPPVLVMNHADHIFWVGLAAADLVIHFRELGKQWSAQYRGTNRSVFLPLPLEDKLRDIRKDPARRRAARQRLGIAANEVVLLTVASAFKYNPVGEWNFVVALEGILDECPNAVCFAVGPKPAGKWAAAGVKYGRRLQFAPEHLDISDGHSDYQLGADVALGSFPFASQGAMLEAGLMGLPAVLTPSAIPYGLDDISFNAVSWPVSQLDYVAETVRLIKNQAEREQEGQALSAAIARHHCPRGWENHINSLLAAIPKAHRTWPVGDYQPLPREVAGFWAAFSRLEQARPLSMIHGAIIAEGIKSVPRHDAALKAALGCPNDAMPLPGLLFHMRKMRYHFNRLTKK